MCVGVGERVFAYVRLCRCAVVRVFLCASLCSRARVYGCIKGILCQLSAPVCVPRCVRCMQRCADAIPCTITRRLTRQHGKGETQTSG